MKIYFSQVVANVAKLHRAVLRNWHHILMMIGNFAGTNVEESYGKDLILDCANSGKSQHRNNGMVPLV